MNQQEINIKIAEFCRISFEKKDICPVCHSNTPYVAGDDYGITIWKECDYCNNTGSVELYYEGLPNYCNDLNAIHEAEKILWTDNPDDESKDGLVGRYKRCLESIVIRDWNINRYQHRWSEHATAAQRAEALYHIITCPQI